GRPRFVASASRPLLAHLWRGELRGEGRPLQTGSERKVGARALRSGLRPRRSPRSRREGAADRSASRRRIEKVERGTGETALAGSHLRREATLREKIEKKRWRPRWLRVGTNWLIGSKPLVLLGTLRHRTPG